MKYEYPEFLRPYTDHTIDITMKEVWLEKIILKDSWI